MKTISKIAIASLLGVSVTACGSPISTSSSGGASVNQNAQGVTKTEITVGTWGPLTGQFAAYAVVSQGANAYFNYINHNGGINGRKIKFKIYDDQYQPDKSVTAAKQLVADKIFAAVAPLGTANNQAADPILSKQGIPILGIATGSSEWGFPLKKNVFGLQPTYTAEGHIMTKFAVKHNHAKTIGVFYQNDDFGKEELMAIEQEAKQEGAKVIAKVAYSRGDTDYSSYALTMKQTNPDAVFEVGVPAPLAQFEKGIANLGWHPQQYITYVSGDPVMFRLAGQAFDKVYTPSWLKNLHDPQVKDFITEYKKDYPNTPPTGLALSGWIDAQVFAEAVKRCGNNLSWSNFEKQMESIHNYTDTASSEPVSYSSTNHQGVQSMSITQADFAAKDFKTIEPSIAYQQTDNPLKK
ncbi:ABC transporter substrate-binding protein [Fodinisporobacter ferrooxydans]|uniref:ABC transporter substrate-binding protein n=1 Tax=Fodinisporobacter ferrooxydans TaxID=2901836 RepID=A0ABY4CHV5_9BACL|nr:ABC transporter substrate-binding protein [Alicyclobacillaceae bacterium MYW30-H2]